MENAEQVCCPEFDPATWDNKTSTWEGKLFIKDTVVQAFHIPLNFGQVITRMWKKAQAAGAAPEDKKEFLLLAYDPSPWKSELYMTVTKEVPGTEAARISGEFFTKVFDGPYNAVPAFIKETESALSSQNKKAEKHYFFYAYCPKCAKKYGHNYVVDFAKTA